MKRACSAYCRPAIKSHTFLTYRSPTNQPQTEVGDVLMMRGEVCVQGVASRVLRIDPAIEAPPAPPEAADLGFTIPVLVTVRPL